MPFPASTGLTQRELQIIELLRKGLPNDPIERDLGINGPVLRVILTGLYRHFRIRGAPRQKRMDLVAMLRRRQDDPASLPSVSGLTGREQQVVGLLLRGYDNPAIAAELKMKARMVKFHFSRLFLKFGIGADGVKRAKRVKLAVMLYRRQKACQSGCMAVPTSLSTNSGSSNSLPTDSPMLRSGSKLE